MKNNATLKEVAFLSVGELAVSLLTLGGYLLSRVLFETEFTWRAITGVLLGSLVIILNFIFLSISVNRAVSAFIEQRGTREMSEEEIEKFTEQNTARIQALMARSFIIRTLSMLAALIVAFVLDWFSPIATIVPMLAFRPLLALREWFRKKADPVPNPENFIKYDADGNPVTDASVEDTVRDETVTEEKESDN